jgi:hypothetical protein
MATGERPVRPGVGLPAAIDVPSYETPVVPEAEVPPVPPVPSSESIAAAASRSGGAPGSEPAAAPKPPPRKLSAAELVTESTRLAVGAVVATGRGLRAILEQAVAVVDEPADERPAPSALPTAVPTVPTLAAGSEPAAPGAGALVAAAAETPTDDHKPPVAALRPPGEPDTVLGALPTAALGAGLHAQRQVLATLAETRERYGPALTWMLEAPGVSSVYQRARANIFAWYHRGAAEKEQGAELALASLKEVSDDGLGYVFEHLDLNTILRGFDINPLLENLELSDVILSSTGGLATDALDNVRSQGVTVDDILARISNRVFRRKPEKIPDGPDGPYGVKQELSPWTMR